MYLRPVFLCVTLVVQVIGVKITHPATGSNWTTSGPNIISWEVEHGDPRFIDIQLVHNDHPSFQPILDLLPADGVIATGVNISLLKKSFTPSCFPAKPSLPAGSGYSLRFLSKSRNGTQFVLKSTGKFHIVHANTTCVGSHTSSASGTPSSLPATPGTSVPSSVSTPADSLSSSLIPNSHAGAVASGIIGGLILCDLLVCGVMIFHRRQRHARKKRQLTVTRSGFVSKNSTETLEFLP